MTYQGVLLQLDGVTLQYGTSDATKKTRPVCVDADLSIHMKSVAVVLCVCVCVCVSEYVMSIVCFSRLFSDSFFCAICLET